MRIALLALVCFPVSAAAYELGERRADGIRLARVAVPATGHTAQAASRIFYLNRNGVTVTPGKDDSRTNRSSIVNRASTIPPWSASPTVWAATVACMKGMFARWDVVVTDEDPGMVPHVEAVFGGSPEHVGLPANVGGVSPFTVDCGVIESSIVFTFTSELPNHAQVVCEVMAQEIAHSFGLDHEMLASDPMSYLSYAGKRTFEDQTVPCGEYEARPCGIGSSPCRPNQNSVALLDARLGADTTPMLEITSPPDGSTRPPGFPVSVRATDDIGVEQVDLYIDDVLLGKIRGAGPYRFSTHAGIADGDHVVRVEATDGSTAESVAITVRVRAGADPSTDDGGGLFVGSCASGHGAGLALGLLVAFRIRRRR